MELTGGYCSQGHGRWYDRGYPYSCSCCCNTKPGGLVHGGGKFRQLRMKLLCVCAQAAADIWSKHYAGALVWLAVNSHAASRHHYEQSDAFRQIIKPGWLPFSTGIDLTDIQVRTRKLPKAR